MRTFVLWVAFLGLLAGGVIGGWVAMNRYAPGSAGTPAHAGALSNGHPEQCTNVNFKVDQRAQTARTVRLDEGDIVRGTFEVNGGFGRVDIIMRIMTPQGLLMLRAPRAENYDFFFPGTLWGDYTFVFDNRYSLFTSKSVGLYYCIEKGGG